MTAKKKQNKGKLSYVLQAIGILPLLCFGITVLLFSSRWFTGIIYREVEEALQNAAQSASTLFNTAYPGDYHLEGETSFLLYKGDSDITDKYELVDQIQKDTGLDITLFYQDTRILTTIRNASGKRIVGSGAPESILRDVLEADKAHFYTHILVNGQSYFAYYMPLHNADGSVVGMLFVGKPSATVTRSLQHFIYPLAFLVILFMLLSSVCIFFYNKKLGSVLLKIRGFLSEVSTGNLNTELDASVLQRNDELGDIGRSALKMQRSLRTMVEQDGLTELLNRRSGDRKLRHVAAKAAETDIPFTVAIGDIDFFKKINDTYGHECGDLVLKNVSALLKRHMFSAGFAARWGGEEFLLVYDHADCEEAHEKLELLLEDIRHMESDYNDQTIRISMTFGMYSANTTDIHELLRIADEKLYIGKTSGRNQIVL